MITAALVLLFLGCFWRELKSLLTSLAWRIKVGAQIKIGTIEIGALEAKQSAISSDEKTHGVRKDNGTMERERSNFYDDCHRVMLVHSLLKSPERGQLFDILIYVVPHKDGSLEGVARVEYYLGESWKHKVFPCENRYSGFAVRTSAYGPFLCTAKIIFSSGDQLIQHRYVDFEMGASAPARTPQVGGSSGPAQPEKPPNVENCETEEESHSEGLE